MISFTRQSSANSLASSFKWTSMVVPRLTGSSISATLKLPLPSETQRTGAASLRNDLVVMTTSLATINTE